MRASANTNFATEGRESSPLSPSAMLALAYPSASTDSPATPLPSVPSEVNTIADFLRELGEDGAPERVITPSRPVVLDGSDSEAALMKSAARSIRANDELEVVIKPALLRSTFDDGASNLRGDNGVQVDIGDIAVAGLHAQPDAIPHRHDADRADRGSPLDRGVAHLRRPLFRPLTPETDMAFLQVGHSDSSDFDLPAYRVGEPTATQARFLYAQNRAAEDVEASLRASPDFAPAFAEPGEMERREREEAEETGSWPILVAIVIGLLAASPFIAILSMTRIESGL